MSDIQPYDREEELFRYINQVEQNLFEGLGSIFGPFRSEFSDDGERYILKIALPGFRKEDINVTVHNGYLIVEAQRRTEHGQERRALDSFERQFTLSGVQADRITAGYRDGLLTLTLPKARPEDAPPARRISLQ